MLSVATWHLLARDQRCHDMSTDPTLLGNGSYKHAQVSLTL